MSILTLSPLKTCLVQSKTVDGRVHGTCFVLKGLICNSYSVPWKKLNKRQFTGYIVTRRVSSVRSSNVWLNRSRIRDAHRQLLIKG